jgi:hypothetical protein
VDNDPVNPLREKRYTNIKLGGIYRLQPRLEIELSGHYKDNEYNSPQFAYFRTIVIGGLRYRF